MLRFNVLSLLVFTWSASIALTATDAIGSQADYVVRTTGNDFNIAFGSCHKLKYADPQLWDTVREIARPDLWLWTGDAMYPPLRGVAPVHMLEREYDNMKAYYAPFLAALGDGGGQVYGTWDDHDYGGNDVGKHMPNISARADLFFDFLGQARPAGRAGVYHSVQVRSSSASSRQLVKIIVLDTRSFRDDHCVPSIATRIPLGPGIACLTRWLSWGLWPRLCDGTGSMLGTAQWQWLDEQLHDDNAWYIVLSSVQVLTTNPVMESWGHFPAERDRLLRLLNGKPALLLSGDVHHAEFSSAHDAPAAAEAEAAPLLEITSSGLTHTCQKGLYGSLCVPLLTFFHRHRWPNLHGYFVGRNFGSIRIDWQQEHYTVNIHNATGGNVVLTTSTRPLATSSLSEEQLQQLARTSMDGHLQPIALAVLVAFVGGIAFVRTRRR